MREDRSRSVGDGLLEWQNLLWVVKHEAHEGSWSGRHGTDRKGPAWHGERQDRPGGQSIEVTRLATSHGVMVKILVGLDYP